MAAMQQLDLERLSDAQLRSKLVQHGLPVMPITSTTRKLIIRKLQSLHNANHPTHRRTHTDTTTLGKFSSDEDDTDIDTIHPPSPQMRRATVSNGRTHYRPSRSFNARNSDSESERVLRNGHSNSIEREYQQLRRKLVAEEEEEDEDSLDVSITDGDLYQTPPKKFTASFRHSPYRPVPILPSSGWLANDDARMRTTPPFLRNFSKRSSPPTTTPRSTANACLLGINTQLQKRWAATSTWLTRQRHLWTRNWHLPAFGGNVVSLVLPSAVGVFFLLLVALYYGLHQGSADLPLVSIVPSSLTREAAQGGRELYAIVRPQLEARATAHLCSAAAPSTDWYMTEDEIVTYVMRHYKVQHADDVRADVTHMTSLLRAQPSNMDVTLLSVPDEGVIEWLDASKHRADDDIAGMARAFAVLAPSLPWSCVLRLRCQWLVYYVLCLGSVGVLVVMVAAVIQRMRAMQQRKRADVMRLVERIVEAMETSDAEFVVINHVRDMIIPLAERKTLDGAWRAAVQFVGAHESRVRTEVQSVMGESYDVWRWVAPAALATPPPSPPAKMWQGQAFEQHAGGVNAPPCSPTPCLKVRGMIDDVERAAPARGKRAVRDDLLVKCGADCRILHVGVDAHAKCVYVRCADTGDAAVAYRQLHGQWYAGHLVTVKYLRLERYMQRFPDCPQRGPPYLSPGDL